MRQTKKKLSPGRIVVFLQCHAQTETSLTNFLTRGSRIKCPKPTPNLFGLPLMRGNRFQIFWARRQGIIREYSSM